MHAPPLRVLCLTFDVIKINTQALLAGSGLAEGLYGGSACTNKLEATLTAICAGTGILEIPRCLLP